MNDNSKIKYNFHNKEGEVVEMTFTIIEIEGMVGGFMNYVQEQLKDMDFGEIESVYRTLLI